MKHGELAWAAGVLVATSVGAILMGAPMEVVFGRELLVEFVPVCAGALFASLLIRGWFGAEGGPGEAVMGEGVYADRGRRGATPNAVVLASAIIYAATVLAVGGVL